MRCPVCGTHVQSRDIVLPIDADGRCINNGTIKHKPCGHEVPREASQR